METGEISPDRLARSSESLWSVRRAAGPPSIAIHELSAMACCPPRYMQIDSSELTEGQPLPSESDLMEAFGSAARAVAGRGSYAAKRS
jgi:hypothetical protein